MKQDLLSLGRYPGEKDGSKTVWQGDGVCELADRSLVSIELSFPSGWGREHSGVVTLSRGQTE